MKIYIKKWMIALLLLLIGIAGVLISYHSFYRPAVDECEKLERSVKNLQDSVAVAKANLQQKAYYEEETEKLISQTQELMDTLHFPGEILEEDQILYIQKVEKETGQKQSLISFGTNNTLYTAGSLVLQEKTYPFTYTTTYEGLKELIGYFVDNDEEPCSLESLTISYDAQTDTCTGTMILRRYYLIGAEEYTPPVIPGVEIGTEQIFG